MKHKDENPKCYRIDIVEEIVKDDSCEHQPTHPLERAIVNSIEKGEDDEDLEVSDCVKQLAASKQELGPVKIEELMGKHSMDAPILSGEGEKNPELKELPSHLKYVFLTKDASKPDRKSVV